MAETEQKHRHNQESRKLTLKTLVTTRGQIFGFILAFSLIIGGVGLTAAGLQTAGLSTLVAAIVPLVIAFFYRPGNSSAAMAPAPVPPAPQQQEPPRDTVVTEELDDQTRLI